MEQGGAGMGVTDSFAASLKNTTAMARVLSYKFEKAVQQFEIKEYKLTGRVVRNNPLPYLH